MCSLRKNSDALRLYRLLSTLELGCVRFSRLSGFLDLLGRIKVAISMPPNFEMCCVRLS